MSALLPTSGGLFSDIISWVRRIIKTTLSEGISDTLIGDYINRFYTYEVPQRIQLFELKRQYTFESIPNTFIYQFPFTKYQMIRPPVYCDGVQMGFLQSDEQFYNIYPEFVNNQQQQYGDDTNGPFTINFATVPILQGFTDDLGNLLPYVYITYLDSDNTLHYIVDNGEGLLLETDSTFQNGPNGGSAILTGTINYLTGVAFFNVSQPVPSTSIIYSQTSPYSAGTPRIMLFFNNTMKLYPVPDRAYKIQADAFITPAQFLTTTDSIPFAYMSEYIARGAARKILADFGDFNQLNQYEPLFKEQENLVYRRTDRIRTTTRTPTIFSGSSNQSQTFYTQY